MSGMTDIPERPTETPLESWKAIAAYLQREVRTVRRWEHTEGLPVHRHRHMARSTVYAYPSELDAWRAGRRPESKRAEADALRKRPTRVMAAAAVAAMTLFSAGSGRLLNTAAEATAQSPASPSRVALSPSWNYAAGPVSADGRYLPYIDEDFNLSIQDLVAGTERLLVRRAEGNLGPFPALAVVSRSGRELAYSWCFAEGPAMTRVCELWTLALDDPDGSRRKLAGNVETFLVPLDWTPDGSSIVARIGQAGTTRIGLVDARSGAVHPLKSINWRQGAARAVVSPDGLDIAYELVTGESSGEWDVLVLARDASREIAAAVNPGLDRLVGWTADGRYLLFASDRRGRRELWAVAWVDRRPQGEPQPVVAVPPGRLLGVTRAGTLLTQETVSTRTIEIVGVDFAAGRASTAPARVFSIGSFTNPTWSPDGASLAYLSRGLVGIRRLDTEATRELYVPSLSNPQGLTWTPDGRSLLVSAARNGRYGIYRIDAGDGAIAEEVVPIGSSNELSYDGFYWSPDARRLYYHSQNGTIHERDTITGATRVVARGSFGPISLSPDGRLIATSRQPDRGLPAAVMLIAVESGEVRELLRLAAGETTAAHVSVPWAPDGRSVLVRKVRDGGGAELWHVPTDGTEPRKLDLDADRVADGAPGAIRVHPDGSRLAWVAGGSISHVWALEHVVPASGR